MILKYGREVNNGRELGRQENPEEIFANDGLLPNVRRSRDSMIKKQARNLFFRPGAMRDGTQKSPGRNLPQHYLI